MKIRIVKDKVFLLVLSMVLALFIVTQSKSFEVFNEEYLRDFESNSFQEVTVLKEKNDALRTEIENLETNLSQLDNQNSALDAIDNEIKKYERLSGRFPVYGPGITITVEKDLVAAWVIDLINEFFNSGAEAVSLNGIRITNKTAGIDTLPQGQILLNGSILTSPYIFNLIGEPSTMSDILELPGGIFSRLTAFYPGIPIKIAKKEIVQMN